MWLSSLTHDWSRDVMWLDSLTDDWSRLERCHEVGGCRVYDCKWLQWKCFLQQQQKCTWTLRSAWALSRALATLSSCNSFCSFNLSSFCFCLLSLLLAWMDKTLYIIQFYAACYFKHLASDRDWLKVLQYIIPFLQCQSSIVALSLCVQTTPPTCSL